MSNADSSSTDRRSRVHTEVRRPIEVILSRLVMYGFGVIEVLIAVRFALKLLGANSRAGFVQMVYGLSDIFMAPFVAIFKTQRVEGSTFELSALFAIVIYALIAWGLVSLVRAVSPRSSAQTVERVENDDDTRATQ